jgi:hypothetical protein
MKHQALLLVGIYQVWSHTLKHGGEVYDLRLNATENFHPSQPESKLVRQNITVCSTSVQNHHTYPSPYFCQLAEFRDEVSIMHGQLAFDQSAFPAKCDLRSQFEVELLVCK